MDENEHEAIDDDFDDDFDDEFDDDDVEADDDEFDEPRRVLRPAAPSADELAEQWLDAELAKGASDEVMMDALDWFDQQLEALERSSTK